MSYDATVIEVFLSSPDDVSSERKLISAMAGEWNRLRGRSTGCFISVLTWEELVAPSLEERPQAAITEQIGESYDVYLGVMWAKLGTPTGAAESGTVEEFDRALARSKAGDPLRIAAIFKLSPIDPTVDAIQLGRVQNFKKRISAEGMFYREFSDENSLRSIANALFEQLAHDKARYRDRFANVSEAKGLGLVRSESSRGDRDDEIGLLEVGEQFGSLVSRFGSKLADMSESENENTAVIQDCVKEINEAAQFGSPDPAAIKKVYKKSAQSMDRLAQVFESTADSIELDVAEMAHLIDTDLRIRLEFDDARASVSQKVSELAGFSDVLAGTIEIQNEAIGSIDSLPRMSTELGRAKKKLSNARQRLRDLFVSLQESVDNSIRYLEEPRPE